jgi:hypothetical protein
MLRKKCFSTPTPTPQASLLTRDIRTMANSPAARAKRKSTKQNYHEDSDSPYESSSSCSEDHPHSPHKKRSDRKKTINSALARAPAGRKVSDDEVHNDTSSKKKNNVASTLKNDVLAYPGKYIYSSFTPPVMNAQDLLLLYKNQVAVPKGASNSLCELFEFVSRNVIVYQDPQKVGIGGTPGPTDHSFNRTGCALHTDSKYTSRSDICPHHPTKLPVALKTAENSAGIKAMLDYIEELTTKLGRIETIPFRLYMIRYMSGIGMGWHSDSLRLADRQGGYRMRLVFNLGESRKIRFRANQIDVNEDTISEQDNRSYHRHPDLGWEIDTIAGFSAYLMSSHGNGSCFLGYTDDTRSVAIKAEHSVSKIGANKGGSEAFVCDFVLKDLRAAMKALRAFRGMVLDK